VVLVLTRRKNESLIIQTDLGDVEVKVLHIKGTQVHIGIDAPREIPVIRREVLEREEQTSHE